MSNQLKDGLSVSTTDTIPRSGRIEDDQLPESVHPTIKKLSRKHRMQWIRLQAARVVLIAALIGAWQATAGTPGESRWILIDKYYVSQPTQILGKLGTWIEDGILFSNIITTLQEMLLGFSLGVILGLCVGFIVGTFKFLGDLLTPLISALYSVPRLALVPLFLLWFGFGLTSKVVFVAMLVFFLIFYNTYSGVRDVDRDLIDMLRVIGAKRRHVLAKIILPSATTWILTGLRISAPYALVGAVTAEMISANRGLGYLLIMSSGQFDIAGVFAAIVVMMLLAIAVNGLVVVAEHFLLAWKRQSN